MDFSVNTLGGGGLQKKAKHQNAIWQFETFEIMQMRMQTAKLDFQTRKNII